MTARLSPSAVRSTVAIACTVVVLALSSTRIASAQGTSGNDQQLSALRQQLSALDRRVKELEKMAVNVDDGKPDAATLDARIARLEAEVRSLQNQGEAGVGSGGPQATKAQGAGPQVLTVKAPFQVVDAAGKVILKVDNAGLSIANKSGNPGVVIGPYKGARMGVFLLGPDGQTIAGRLALDQSDLGRLQVGRGDDGSGGVDVGVGSSSGAGFVMVRTPAGKDGVALGVYRGAPMGVSVIGPDGQSVEASLATGQKGGSVKVMNPAGVPMAALLAGDTGGGLALTGPAGGKSAVSLSVESSGGKVRVFPQAGGSVQAELAAASDAGGGAVNVYNGQGEAVGWLEATSGGNGQFTIGRAGKIYVKAAVLENGRGMIIAGPRVGGAPPGLVIPYYLEGR
jgi:hypothetical protein